MFSWCRALILTGHVKLHESGQKKYRGKQREGWGGVRKGRVKWSDMLTGTEE